MQFARGDDASLVVAARAVAAETNDEEVARFATAALREGKPLDRHLADLAADTSVPVFARAQAILLVSRVGGEAAGRRVVALREPEPALATEIDAARGRITDRFGTSAGGAR